MDEKAKFLNYELWSLTIAASFQRAKVYKSDNVKQVEARKVEFKTYLRNLIEDIVIEYDEQEILEEQHIANIKKIVSETKNCEFKDILSHGGLHFGIAQKLLNLYLKYQWCAGFLNIPPPHFPVDRRIQEAMRLKEIIAWTQVDKMTEGAYRSIIEVARSKAKAKTKKQSLAKFELVLFNEINQSQP